MDTAAIRKQVAVEVAAKKKGGVAVLADSDPTAVTSPVLLVGQRRSFGYP